VILDGAEGFSPLVWMPGVMGRRRAVSRDVAGVGVGTADVRPMRAAESLRRVKVENCMVIDGELWIKRT